MMPRLMLLYSGTGSRRGVPEALLLVSTCSHRGVLQRILGPAFLLVQPKRCSGLSMRRSGSPHLRALLAKPRVYDGRVGRPELLQLVRTRACVLFHLHGICEPVSLASRRAVAPGLVLEATAS